MNQIPPHALWIGHAGDGRNNRELLDRGIKAIVQVAAEEPPIQPLRDAVYLRFPLNDGADNSIGLIELVVDSLAFLVSLGMPTLVCCSAGVSRSPAVAAAAIASVTGEPPDEVLERILRGRPVTCRPASGVN